MSASFLDPGVANPGDTAAERWTDRLRIGEIDKEYAVEASVGQPPGSGVRLPSSSTTLCAGWGRVASVCVHAAALLLLCRLFWPVPSLPYVAAPVTMVFAPPGQPGGHTIVLPQTAIPEARHEDIARLAKLSPAGIGPSAARRAAPALRRGAPSAAVQDRRIASVSAGHPPASAHEAAIVPPAADQALLAGFAGQVQRAVQEAAVYPALARRMRMQGRVRVVFAYESGPGSGMVSGVTVAQASQSQILDRAALAAVRRAAYPPAPPSVGRRLLPMTVWVDFSLGPDG